jgi:DNA (cytosine-5)-methyltransferase 1
MTAYYNEIDEYAAQWLRNLIAAGHIAPGDVDTRSITEVHPDDIKNYNQCHFFAGIGVWSYALRRAGWADSRPVWTGSCPCQPFSIAGKGDGFDDERHLWPVFGNLIRERRPPTVFGEQVASKDADAWVDIVQADLENMGYAVGAVPFPAAGVGAPHIRDRLYWMARDLRMGDSGSAGLEGHHRHGGDRNESGRYNAQSTGPVGATGGFSRVVFAAECDDEGNCPQCGDDFGDCECIGPTEDDVEYIWIDGELYGKRLADTDSDGCQSRIITAATVGQRDSAVADGGTDSASPLNGFWRDADWLLCRDGKWRPVEPGTFPLAHGITNRVGRLRAYGNAICAEAAIEFIKIAMEYQP